MSYIKTAVIILILAMTLSVVLSYASMMTIVSTTKENTQRVLDSFVMNNSVLIYDSIKNGNDFTEYIDTNAFLVAFDEELSLDLSGNMLYSKDAKGNIIFKMKNIVTTYQVENTLKLQTNYDLLIPVRFAGKGLFDLRIPIIVKASYNLKS